METLSEDEELKSKMTYMLVGVVLLIIIYGFIENQKLATERKKSEAVMAMEYEFVEPAVVVEEPAVSQIAVEEMKPFVETVDGDDAVMEVAEIMEEAPVLADAAADEVEPMMADEEMGYEMPVVLATEDMEEPMDELIKEEVLMEELPTALVAEAEEVLPADMQVCKLKEMGIQFACDLNWKITEDKDGVEWITVEKKPLIQMALQKMDKKFSFLSQLNVIYFQKIGFYKEGFQTEKVSFAGHDAILVKAISSLDMKTQRRDYFYIYDGSTIHISFILPNSEWTRDEQSAFKGIIDQFQNY